MLDVHPPHEAAHTWKDFFIHIATIVIGLLIAIGLEQTVEAIHRQHERHLLEQELNHEAQNLQRGAEIDIDLYDAELKFSLAQLKDVNLRIATNGKANPPPRTFVTPLNGHGVTGRGGASIDTLIWDSAKADGRIALLPEDLKSAWGQVSWRRGVYDQSQEQAIEAGIVCRSFLSQFSDVRTPNTPDFSRMSIAQLIELRALYARQFQTIIRLRRNTVLLSYEAKFALQDEARGTRAMSRDAYFAFMGSPSERSLNFVQMANETDAEDNARDKGSPTAGKQEK